MNKGYEVIICGAGITGVAAAYYLTQAGVKDILLIDQRPPLSFTSDRSTECYRNWWPDPQMLSLMNHSIDLMEQLAHRSGNIFRMNRRGYLYVSANEDGLEDLINTSHRISDLGAGPIRIHSTESSSYIPSKPEGFNDTPIGADLLLGNNIIQKYFPYVTDKAVSALHVRRAGWLSAQQLGIHLLDSARKLGVQYEAGKVIEVMTKGGVLHGIRINSGRTIHSPNFIVAAGPFLKEVGLLLGVELPVYSELHIKTMIKDSLGVVGRKAPLLIWNDEQNLPWEMNEREALINDPETRWLTSKLPGGAHTRPEGSGNDIIMLWEYQTRVMDPVDQPVLDPQVPEAVLRGLSTMLPKMKEYFSRIPRPQMDGGFYTKTPENRPLVGPLGVDGAFVVGAVSGYGIMSACGVGELIAAHFTGAQLPEYASAFLVSRYDDPQYNKELEKWIGSGQL